MSSARSGGLTKQRLDYHFCREWAQDDAAGLVQTLQTDPLLFLSYVWTLDEHDAVNPIKRFPSETEKPYLWELAELWCKTPLLVVAKSRQVMATWLFAILYLWEVMYHPAKRVFFQSKKEEDAIGILERVIGVMKRLPAEIVPKCKPLRTRLVFEHDSWLSAIPQGADQVRSYTFSGGLVDEAGFQDAFAESFAAVMPTLEGGGRLTVVSTANLSFFWKLYADELDAA